MTKKEIAISWLKWLKESIDNTIDLRIANIEVNYESDIDWLIHYLQESIELDLGKFERGLKREVSKGGTE
jgi:hypothetical protein